ncbi:dihydrolipoamide acetyltransferase family protein [Buchnera aphidicola (Mollitrichosiphum nigrofasciatum)]|uniref:dihydrolipoamide acetyltransferase family protein n=1 Tax=Buchnera aphidicola TaxID=9 RepID=UPI0031B8437F
MDIIVQLPDIGIDEAEVVEILVHSDKFIKKNQGILNIEGHKSAIEIPSPEDGIIKEIFVKIGDKIHTNDKICVLTIKEKILQNKEKKNVDNDIIRNKNLSRKSYFKKKYIKKQKTNHASPLIRRLIRLNKIDISRVSGTGRKGRILREDIDHYLNNLNQKKILDNVTSSNKNINDCETIKSIKFNNIQKNIIFNLKKSWKNIPHVTHFEDLDITELENFRIKYNTNINSLKLNTKITLLPFILKIVAQVLKKFPKFNSSLDLHNNQIILKKNINIGIVVNTIHGLFIPVIKNVYKKKILDIVDDIHVLSKKAHNRKLLLTEMNSGTFTVSNLGKFGGGFFTPIINFPEVSILGMSRVILKPNLINKKLIERIILPISLSYDHRVINGVDAGEFIFSMNELISDIRYLLM